MGKSAGPPLPYFGGVLGVLPGIVGTIQTIETIKLILELGEPLVNRLLLVDSLAMEFREVKIRRDPACPVCGDNPTVTELIDYEQFCGLAPGQAPPEAEHGVAVAAGESRPERAPRASTCAREAERSGSSTARRTPFP